MPKLTKKDYKRKCEELEAQLTGILHFADVRIQDTSKDKFIGSAIIVRLHALGGAEVAPPFAIRDGFSEDTIRAIRRDIARSYEIANMFKPGLLGEI